MEWNEMKWNGTIIFMTDRLDLLRCNDAMLFDESYCAVYSRIGLSFLFVVCVVVVVLYLFIQLTFGKC
jgi:hypothetical protein